MTPFPVRKTPELARINADVLEHWQSENTFQRSLEHRRSSKPWVFYEGPPSANGVPGIHHVLGRTLKDTYCRYKAQCGYYVARRAGWDTHGLPVELSVERELGITKEDIGRKVSVEEYNRECRKAVMRFSQNWRELTERLGYWVDMDQPYVTYDSKYMESVWWLLKKLFDQSSLYRGYTIQPFSPMAGTGLSSHELNQPGAYKEVTDLSVTAMFRVSSLEGQEKRAANARQANPHLPPSPAALQNADLLAALETGTLYFLAWTTTPWTLPSNTALAVNPQFQYDIVETLNKYTGGRVFVILAHGLVERVFDKAEFAQSQSTWDGRSKGPVPYRVVGTLSGSDLVGMWYEQLLAWTPPAEAPEQAFRVVAGDFVSLEDGTGIVHIAPTFGADDARVAKLAGVPALRVLDANQELVPLVDQRGRFVPQAGELAGKAVKRGYYGTGEETLDVDEHIVMLLKREGNLFRSLKYKHSYPHCWRTDAPVIYYPLKSWFIKSTDFKPQLIALNKTIQWHPESTGTGRFGEWLENLADWNLSRSRFWGIPLPIWATEDGSEFKCIGSFEELQNEIKKAIAAGVMTHDPFEGFVVGDYSDENYSRIDVHRPGIDQVKLVSERGQVMTRESEVIDVWFDSGAMPFAQVHYPFENADAVETKREYPADFILEGVDQTRGWFFTLHTISTMLFQSVAFKHVLSHGLVLDAEGRKMSKRLGNAVEPMAVLERFGADPVRWYMVTNSPPWLNLRFDLAGVEEVVRKFYGTLWSTYSFFATYANADDFSGGEAVVPVAERPELDRWIRSELELLVESVRKHMDEFDATRAYRAVQAFVIDDLSNWYVRLNRRRFWKSEMGKDKLAAYQTAHECLLTVCKLIAPVSPFHAEQLYGDLTTRHPHKTSVHLEDYPTADLSLVDDALNQQMRTTRRVASLALSLRKDKGIKVRQPLSRLTIITEPRLGEALESMRALLCDEINVKEVAISTTDSELIDRQAQLDFRAAGPRFGKQTNALAAEIKALSGEPLARLAAGQSIAVTVGGETVGLTPDLVKITSKGKAGAELASDGNVTVLLDTQLTQALEREGFARELVSAIQRLRKSAGFEVTTRIVLLAAKDEALEAALGAHGDYIRAETLCIEVRLLDTLEVEPTLVEERALCLSVQAA